MNEKDRLYVVVVRDRYRDAGWIMVRADAGLHDQVHDPSKSVCNHAAYRVDSTVRILASFDPKWVFLGALWSVGALLMGLRQTEGSEVKDQYGFEHVLWIDGIRYELVADNWQCCTNTPYVFQTK